MSEWSYYDKDNVVRNTKATKDDTSKALREIAALRQEFQQFARDQKAVAENQRVIMQQQQEIVRTLAALKSAVDAMHDEMYPQVEDTKKPGLKKPLSAHKP